LMVFLIIAGLIIVAFVLESFLVNVKIITDKKEYSKTEALKIKIKNNLSQNICFSSCYPYYLENKENQEWEMYSYQNCESQDLIEKCIEPKEQKAFEIDLSLTKIDLHRIVLPVCVGCQLDQGFQENQRFYSNEFEIK
ncbi:hypothetical protein KKE78_02315, partial [Patescibacteria group bacterium]|nr:hypothetical protein [Patescibacteria group bacterium]